MPESTGFYELYRDAPAERREWLRSFRLRHPRQHFTWQGIEWEYIASGAPDGEPRATEHWILRQNHEPPGDGEEVLVLGGLTSTAESSFDLIAALERHHRVLSLSYPAIGTVSQLLEGMVALMDSLGLPKVHVFGHSLGAGIGHAFLRRYPERVDRLVLSSFGLYGTKSARKTRLALALLRLLPYGFVKRYFYRRLSRTLRYVDAAGAPTTASEAAFRSAYLKDLLEYQHNRSSLMGQLALMADLIDHADGYGVWEPVERPQQVLIIQAEDDRGFASDEQEALRNVYPGAQVRIFERGGHNLRRSYREAYDRVLMDFLRGGES